MAAAAANTAAAAATANTSGKLMPLYEQPQQKQRQQLQEHGHRGEVQQQKYSLRDALRSSIRATKDTFRSARDIFTGSGGGGGSS